MSAYCRGIRGFNDTTRRKVVAAGRRTGKSRLAAWLLIINALQTEKGQVFYVAPTQGQARDIMWQTPMEPNIRSSLVLISTTFRSN